MEAETKIEITSKVILILTEKEALRLKNIVQDLTSNVTGETATFCVQLFKVLEEMHD